MTITFTDTMANIVYEFDDREIYNDIRSEIEITETTEVPGQETVWGKGSKGEYADAIPGTEHWPWIQPGANSETVDITIPHGSSQQTQITNIEASPSALVATVVSIAQTDSKTIVYAYATNVGSGGWTAYIRVYYTYIKVPGVLEHTDTNQYTLKIRSKDDESIAQYGRRVMDLAWPLGQTQDQMQALIDSYLARYSQPTSRVTMTVIGKTDALIVAMLTLAISDKITVINTVMGLNAQFFINNIQYDHDVHGLPTAVYTLEEIRDTETWVPWIWDIAQWDISRWA